MTFALSKSPIFLIVLVLVCSILATCIIFGIMYCLNFDVSIINFLKCWFILGINLTIGVYIWIKITDRLQVDRAASKNDKWDDDDWNYRRY